MLKVAITGNIAAGKSEAEKVLREMSFKVLDADEVVHELLRDDEDVKNKFLETFSDFDILEYGEISRSKLGKIVFTNETAREKSEKILHPLVKDEIKKFFNEQEKQGEKIAFVSVPLLFEAHFEDIFDKIILIYADDAIRRSRLMQRSNLTVEQAQNRLDIQMNQDDKKNLSDFIIYNNEKIEDLSKNIDNMLKSIGQF